MEKDVFQSQNKFVIQSQRPNFITAGAFTKCLAFTVLIMGAACDGTDASRMQIAQTEQQSMVPTKIQLLSTKDKMAHTGPDRIGFAFTYFWYDMLETPKDCPAGYAFAMRDLAILDLPKAKQEFLLKAENRSTYYKMGYVLSARRHYAQKGESLCNIPTAYKDPPHRTVQSTTAYGRNLDNNISAGGEVSSCGAVDFTSPDGRTGIDNQLYRVMGCIDSYRRDAEFAGGAMEDYHVGAYRDGEITTLMEVRGVDDLQNDDEIEIGVYSSHEPTSYDSKKEGIPSASLTISENTLWHNVAKGRIENGVIITEPFELRLKFGWVGRPAEYLIKDTQMHLTINEDGSLAGDLVGFFDLQHAYWSNFHDERGALQVANGYTCSAVWESLQEHADGYPDAETGKCQAISTALRIEAVPAYVLMPPEESLTKYVLDTRKYYKVPLETIQVSGAEVRALEGAGGPPSGVDLKNKIQKTSGDTQ